MLTHAPATKTLVLVLALLLAGAGSRAEAFSPAAPEIVYHLGADVQLHLATTDLIPFFGINGTIDWGNGVVQSVDLDPVSGHAKFLGNPVHIYTQTGPYRVTLSYNFGGLHQTSLLLTVIPPGPLPLDSFFMVSLGDSVASGEGNPPFDDSSSCDRGPLAGPRQAWLTLVGQNPSTVLQIAHVACSGATTSTLVSTQVPAAAAAFPPGEVDAIVMTIGANDTVSGKGDFGSVVESCLKDDNCHTSTSLKTEISNKLDALPGSYATVDVTVRSQFPRAQVYLAEYYDATHHADGSFGNFATNFGCTFDLITADEWKFIHDSFLVPLNAAGATAASLHQWHYIGGIADAFKKHGMCAGDERWVLTAEDSIDQMGGVKPTLDISFYKFHFSYNERALKGTAHPNHEGHLQYGLAIAHALNAGTPPQTRATATGVDGPYPFGTWTRGPVVITFELRNLLGAGDLGTRWRFAGGTPATPPGDLVERYFGPFEWDRPGHWTFFYGSTSGFGAVEAVQRVTVMIDPIPPFTKPTATASGKPYTFGSKIGGTVNVSLGAVELGGDQSGVRDLTYSAIGAQPVPATTVLGDSASLVITKPGVTAITLKARDVAGNVSDSQTVTVDICGADASSRVAVIRGGFRKNFNTGRMVQTVTLTNRGSTSLVGPFSLVVRDLPAGVTLANATPGTCTSGGPAIQVPATLAPSQSTVIVLEFTTSSSAGITYTTQVLTGPAG